MIFSEFYAKEQARTKKLANSLVAWSIMKQLYQVSPDYANTKPVLGTFINVVINEIFRLI